MDAQRELLNQLMGKDRDLPASQQRRRRFTDRDVCKHFLCGLCPLELFANTKSDLGPHPHGVEDDEAMRAEFERLDPAKRARYGYDRELLRLLEDLITGCDRKIERNRERVIREELEMQPTPEDAKAILKLDLQIEDFVGSAEALAAAGDVEAAFEMLSEGAPVARERDKRRIGPESLLKRTMVCDTCGNFMSTADGIDRLRCHFAGRQFQGWRLCREKMAELRERVGRGGGGSLPPPVMDAERERSRDRRDRGPDRDYDRDRSRDRDSAYDRDRRDRDRDRDRHRSRDRDRRGRDYDRRDRRGGDRGRDRGRDRGGGGSYAGWDEYRRRR